MRFKILLTIIAGLLFMGGSVYADDAKDFPITGEVELGVRSVHDGQKSAKFNEYKDMRQGVFSNMHFGGDNGSYFLDFTGENVGRDDQFFQMKGGKYGSFDYSVYYNEIIHNWTFGAKTFYANPGSNSLDYGYANKATSAITATWSPSVPTNKDVWNTFDYSKKMNDTGASVNFSFGTPFYISVDANQLETSGIKPRGTASDLAKEIRATGTSSGNIELPAPIDYLTSNLNVRTGFNTKNYSLAVGGTLSKFENANEFVSFRNPFVVSHSQSEVFSDVPDNSYYKLMAQGSARQLPLNSSLAVNLGLSRLENKIDLLNTTKSVTAGSATTLPDYYNVTLGLNTPQFKGDIKYQTASVALTSAPLKALSTKIYYNYLKKQNDSTQIEYSNGASTLDNELFGYDKNNYGIDVGLKLGKTKLSTGYEYLKVGRDNRADAVSSKDDSFYLELKNNSMEWLTAKLKYKRLIRDTDFQDWANTDSNYLWFFRRFDVAKKVEDSYKVGVEFDPTDRFNLALEYTYKKNDYEQDPTLRTGRQSDKRDDYYADMSYQIPDVVTFTAFVDYEKTSNIALYRSNSTNPANGSLSSTVYNYTGDLNDTTYFYGVGLRAPIIKNKLDLVASWTYEKANGNVDFQSPNDWGAGGSANKWWDVPISDDYTKQSVNLKAIYHVAKNLDMTFGFAYEDYTYEDLSTEGYTNLMPNTTSPTMFYSGAYANSNYRVNTTYLAVGYKF